MPAQLHMHAQLRTHCTKLTILKEQTVRNEGSCQYPYGQTPTFLKGKQQCLGLRTVRCTDVRMVWHLPSRELAGTFNSCLLPVAADAAA
jgi:hypothetical protein